MFETPKIKIEIEGVRSSILHHFDVANNDLNKRILNTIEETLTLDYIDQQIKQVVFKCLTEAIDDVANNYQLKSAITTVVSDSITKILKEGANHD